MPDPAGWEPDTHPVHRLIDQLDTFRCLMYDAHGEVGRYRYYEQSTAASWAFGQPADTRAAMLDTALAYLRLAGANPYLIAPTLGRAADVLADLWVHRPSDDRPNGDSELGSRVTSVRRELLHLLALHDKAAPTWVYAGEYPLQRWGRGRTGRPRYAAETRTLAVGPFRKTYRTQATKQTAVLEAFEAAGWPAEVPRPKGVTDAAQTAKDMNTHLGPGCPVRFTGTAEAVRWEPKAKPKT